MSFKQSEAEATADGQWPRANGYDPGLRTRDSGADYRGTPPLEVVQVNQAVLVRAVLMSSTLRTESAGFSRLQLRVDGGRWGMFDVAVMISTDAYKKVVEQRRRARQPRLGPLELLQAWSRWEISRRLHEDGSVPATITIAASQVDDFGAYACEIGRSIKLR
jgi:hypothetical protein